MYNQEHNIAQAEFAACNDSSNKPALEGATVKVPNIFDRLVASLMNAFRGPNGKPTQRDAALSRGATAWSQVKAAIERANDTAYLSQGAVTH